eukprot:6180375-Pleurochrysis_carterae.AAC.1
MCKRARCAGVRERSRAGACISRSNGCPEPLYFSPKVRLQRNSLLAAGVCGADNVWDPARPLRRARRGAGIGRRHGRCQRAQPGADDRGGVGDWRHQWVAAREAHAHRCPRQARMEVPARTRKYPRVPANTCEYQRVLASTHAITREYPRVVAYLARHSTLRPVSLSISCLDSLPQLAPFLLADGLPKDTPPSTHKRPPSPPSDHSPP